MDAKYPQHPGNTEEKEAHLLCDDSKKRKINKMPLKYSPAIRSTARSAGSSCRMLSGLSFAHSLRLPSSSNSMIPATVRFFFLLTPCSGAALLVVRRQCSFALSLHHNVTWRATVYRHCLHRCTRSDTDLPPVISVRATRASRPTCVYCCEKRNTYIPYPSRSPPPSHFSLSPSLFLLLRGRASVEPRALFTRIVCTFVRWNTREIKSGNGRKQRV